MWLMSSKRRVCAYISFLQTLGSTASNRNPAQSALTNAASSSGRRLLWGIPALAMVPLCTAVVLADSPKDQQKDQASSRRWTHLLSLETRQRVFFNYEKRVRDMSPLDKVFEYFSSQHHDGIKYMLPRDLLKAIVPTYPASRSLDDRGGWLEGERQPQGEGHHAKKCRFFERFDVDGDGYVSYMEFLLVLTLLSIPKLDVHIIFDVVDINGNGEIDANEFDVIIKMLQAKANMYISKYHVGRHAKLSPAPAAGLLTSFFGPDNNGKLKLKDFSTFLDMLHEELAILEFEHYMPDDKGRIPGIDFARSLVAAADLYRVDDILNKVDGLAPELNKLSISFAEFSSIIHFQAKLDPVKVALHFMQQIGRPVGKEDLRHLAQRLTGTEFTDQVLDAIMLVFDNGQGSLNIPLFVDTMKRRSYFWERRRLGSDVLSKNSIHRMWNCFQTCTSG